MLGEREWLRFAVGNSKSAETSSWISFAQCFKVARGRCTTFSRVKYNSPDNLFSCRNVSKSYLLQRSFVGYMSPSEQSEPLIYMCVQHKFSENILKASSPESTRKARHNRLDITGAAQHH